jgi:hypothetical protein
MLFHRLKCQTAKIKMDYPFSPSEIVTFYFDKAIESESR